MNYTKTCTKYIIYNYANHKIKSVPFLLNEYEITLTRQGILLKRILGAHILPFKLSIQECFNNDHVLKKHSEL